jgi:hypothetical protein
MRGKLFKLAFLLAMTTAAIYGAPRPAEANWCEPECCNQFDCSCCDYVNCFCT